MSQMEEKQARSGKRFGVNEASGRSEEGIPPPEACAPTQRYGVGRPLYLPETRESICPVKPEVFLSMYRSDAVIRRKL